MHNRYIPKPIPLQVGFSMLEILITLVIIATALLGTAGLQIYAMRLGSSSQFRSQAVFLVSDMAERIEANKMGAVAGNYVVSASSSPSVATSNCATSACDSASLANWDISQWEQAVTAASLPAATWSIAQTVAGNPTTYSIMIRWTDRGADKSSRGETFSYTATRTLSD